MASLPSSNTGNCSGMLRCQPLGRRGATDASRRKGVIANNGALFANDEATRSVGRLVPQRSPLQPLVKGRLSALEPIQRVLACKQPRRRQMERSHFSHGALVLSKRRSFPVGGKGRSSSVRNFLKVSASTEK